MHQRLKHRRSSSDGDDGDDGAGTETELSAFELTDSGVAVPTGIDEPGRGKPERLLVTDPERELSRLEAAADSATLTRPYLPTVPDSTVAFEEVFDWLSYLLSTAGRRQTFETLRYYRTIGWIGPDAEDALRNYCRLFDDGQAPAEPALFRRDHVVSLVFIARLASMV
ncbi:MAG: FlaD/FlaE family flagellar protein [Halobacteriales archaeon]